jgi:hypothetical protein
MHVNDIRCLQNHPQTPTHTHILISVESLWIVHLRGESKEHPQHPVASSLREGERDRIERQGQERGSEGVGEERGRETGNNKRCVACAPVFIQVIKKVQKGVFEFPDHVKVSEQGQDFVRKLICVKVEDRYTAEQVSLCLSRARVRAGQAIPRRGWCRARQVHRNRE